jgi:hypothetical protein
MLRRRPAAATFFGISNIIVGALGIFFYVCAGFVTWFLMTDARTASVWDYLGHEVRLFRPMMVAHYTASLLICLLLIPAGVGLLGMHHWGRLLSLACAVLAVLLNVWNFIFQLAFVAPALRSYVTAPAHPFDQVHRAADAAGVDFVVYGGSTLACVYSVIMAVMLLLPDTAAAFRQGRAPAWLDDFADDDRPRRRRREYDDDWDD